MVAQGYLQGARALGSQFSTCTNKLYKVEQDCGRHTSPNGGHAARVVTRADMATCETPSRFASILLLQIKYRTGIGHAYAHSQ